MVRTFAVLVMLYAVLAPSELAAEDAVLNIEIKELKKQSTLVIKKKNVKQAEIGAALAEILPRVGAYLGAQKIQPLAAPMAHYIKVADDAFDLEGGVVVPDGTKGEGVVIAGVLPAGKAAYAVHVGPYEKLPATYAVIKAELKSRGLKDSGTSWEFYVSDPGTTKPEELKTEIYMPVEAAK